MEGSSALADYRQRVAEMYLTRPRDGADGLAAFRAAREELFLTHPCSALDDSQRRTGVGPAYYERDAGMVVTTTLVPVDDGERVAMDTGGEDGILHYRRLGRMVMPVGELTLFWLLGYGGGLFLPFRDATGATSTYGGGRYLTDTIKGTYGRGLVLDGDAVTLDFNYAYNPSCAYNSAYLCPLAPRENWLVAPVPAGEMRYSAPK
ncbi:MAG TPA: DUF1684 domain-containing protein [Mycobacteriales bacterium]